MLEAIEKLLILQDRDRQIGSLEAELAVIPPQRLAKQQKAAAARAKAEAARKVVMELETARKQLELEVETQQENIHRFSLQQFQTKKNDEYQALGREIEGARRKISKLEDQQLELMEQTEQAEQAAQAAANEAAGIGAEVERELADLEARQKNLHDQLGATQSGRDSLAEAVEDGLRSRYERLRKTKGDRVLVGVDRGICGGCHMKLQPHLLLTCRSGSEIATCSSCGRLLYYERGMEL
ncbi:MAG: hypothetical protein H7A45_02750 [Verrucomicrobiales bacterium]|nr:hypothetical protein [Verrucomicrobiales bacterium]MCP5526416.1 hypothetical protein [Verrucomicrobiales bacterium]